MKKTLFITGLIILLTASCRGPLAKPEVAEQPAGMMGNQGMTGAAKMEAPKLEREELTIEPVQGGVTLAELFTNKKDYSGKTVKIKGKVTKVNPEIMGKNWIHIQDGTMSDGQFDLTITSDFVPEIGSILTLEGKIALDKDFGYGYTYQVLMEEAKIVQ